VILVLPAPTPLEILRVIATQASLEMEEHALILMSAHWKQINVILMQTAPTQLEASCVIATPDLSEMDRLAMVLLLLFYNQLLLAKGMLF